MKRNIFALAAALAAVMGLMAGPVFAQSTVPPLATDMVKITRLDTNGNGTNSAIPLNTMFNSAGMGYSVGGGAAVTQLTSRTTGVTINALAGAITLFSVAGSTTSSSFVVTNSKVAATDVIIVNEKSGTDTYTMDVTAVGAGTFTITSNTKTGTTVESPVFNFVVIKGAAS